MNRQAIFTLKALRRIHSKAFSTKGNVRPECDQDANSSANTIYEALISDNSCMIARFGSTEMACLANYLGVKNNKGEVLNYIKGKAQSWWWEQRIIRQMQEWSGFFPVSIDKINEFCNLMLRDIPEVNVLGSWLPEEKLFIDELQNAKKVRLIFLDPYWSSNPWTKALEDKKVLVVHPFAETIEQQYKKRKQLFKDNLLPRFELKTVKAVQSIAGEKTEFNDWFSALNSMKEKIDQTDYDICLIGCGAYGFPLAAHVKRSGKKGFHLGGSLQLLFGIRGSRWENTNYNQYDYPGLINPHWVRPGESETPLGASKVEGACYW